jgi:hypothetical protein
MRQESKMNKTDLNYHEYPDVIYDEGHRLINDDFIEKLIGSANDLGGLEKIEGII